MEREQLKSRLGFILLSAGCAIGLGNVWKFPYMTGQYGGSIFVLLYVFFLILLGVPAMTMEFSLGRAAQISPINICKKLMPQKKITHFQGKVSFFGNYLLMMFYTGVAGWLINYFVKMASGTFVGLKPNEVAGVFGAMLSSPVETLGYMVFTIFVGFGVCAIGLQTGIEKITKYMMMLLLFIMLLLVAKSVTMEGASEGLRFFLYPNVEKFLEIGIFKVALGALNQAFFTLSLGIGCMAIFGSYIGKERSLMGEAVNVAILDSFVAMSSGFIIFPACFAFGINPDAGPSLIFITLPNVFNNMELGQLWGSLFFVFMSFAALSTVFAVFENIVSCTMDIMGWARKKACAVNVFFMILLSAPCMLGFNLWSFIQPFGKGSCILDLEDYILSNIILPLGSLAFVIFCTWDSFWGWEKFKEEANHGKGIKVAEWMYPIFKYVIPIIILTVWIAGLL